MQIPLAASLPISSLGSFADLRRDRHLRIVVQEDLAWIVWDSPDPALVHRLMTIPNSRLFSRESGGWTLLGNRVPSFNLPIDVDNGRSLVHEIIPAHLEPTTPDSAPLSRVELRLVRDPIGLERPATLLICDIGTLTEWADMAVSSAFDRLSGATSGRAAIVRGAPLPTIVATSRYWGNRVLCPLGFQLNPALPEPAILQAHNVPKDRLLIFHDEEPVSHETVPLSVLVPLSRASIRIAMRECTRP